MNWLWIGAGVALAAVLLYWQLVVAEGTHLGARVVTWLYDISAGRYEAIKQFDAKDDDDCLGWPLTVALAATTEPLVLDVACGSGRLSRTLLRQFAFDGRVLGVDRAMRMLAQARTLTPAAAPRVYYLPADAQWLPFAANRFDAVVCLEAFEFMPNPNAALLECLRVLRPGGTLLVSNRIGRDAALLFGKTWSRAAFEGLLDTLPLQDYRVTPWLDMYDLGMGEKGMNYLRYTLHDAESYGWVEGDQVGAITGDLFDEHARVGLVSTLDKVKLLPPTKASKVIAMSRNYESRLAVLGIAKPDVPIFFFKPTSAMIGYGAPIVLPPQSKRVEHEAELAIVISRKTRYVSVEDAPRFVFGYTCANDITARDLYMGDTFMARSKSFDTFCAIGPWVNTTLDPADALIVCKVNGQTRQMASTREMNFSVAQIIAYLSSIMTLNPGDVILTGTPAGAGPLADGDVVEVEIEGVGVLRNPVQAANVGVG